MPLYEYSQSMLNVPILICLPQSDGRITHQWNWKHQGGGGFCYFQISDIPCLDSNLALLVRFQASTLKTCFFLGYYIASSGSSLLMFRDNLSVPSARVKNSNKTLEDGTARMSWITTTLCTIAQKSAVLWQFLIRISSASATAKVPNFILLAPECS